MFIPRYRPMLWTGNVPEARLPGPPFRLAFRRAREALAAYFETLPKGIVLVSAQICPAVPFLLRRRGFTVTFVDVDPAYPCPGPEQFRQGLTSQTVAVIASPFYGLAPPWTEWEGPRLVLDLAQGLGTWSELAEKAEAVVYSFGLGKGPDCGGGLLCTREPVPAAWPTAGSPLPATWLKAAMVRLALTLGFYRLLVGRGVDSEKEDQPVAPRLAPAGFWRHHVGAYLEQARRARDLYRTLPGAVPEYVDALPLRTILRPPARDEVLARLLERGIDALPAGELLPSEYWPDVTRDFPNAFRFRREAVRLPFLGRLSEREMAHLKRALAG